ncbi:MAG: LysM peptidoglycan-binding domain-containing protein [Deltaproteobacteria bacterium]|nr:LysM peptidoglycan-binding domain-containing protein [Deltaproteobacteria bacterium]
MISQSSPTKKVIILLCLLFFSGCATGSSNFVTEKETSNEGLFPDEAASTNGSLLTDKNHSLPVTDEKWQNIAAPHENSNAEQLIPSGLESNSIKSDQELLDSALEFCRASNDFWEQGDLENALDALDQAYSFILKVCPDDPEILQQREDLRYTISKRIMEVYASRFTAANGVHKAIPRVMNSHVKSALSLLLGKDKNFFLNSYRRSGKYRPAIVKALHEAGLPEELSWLPLIESGFKIRALSRARALGLWQFIASTGYKFGLKRDRWIDERMNLRKSTMAAIAYLTELHHIFGDWTTALAAYNCGEGTVLRSIRTQRINYLDNFWDLYNKLPRETAFYVPKFLAVLHILNDPEAYGIVLPPVDKSVEFEQITINKQAHLKDIAKSIGVPFRELKELNSELRYNFTPDRRYVFNVPEGYGKVLLAKIDEIPVWHEPVPAYVVHRVRKGESISVIARRYKTSVKAIMRNNRLKNSSFIRAGRKLKIPTGRSYAGYKKSSVPIDTSRTRKPGGKSVKYTVRKGDSLWKIANRFGVTTKEIKIINKLHTSYLRIGQRIIVPTGWSVANNGKTKSYLVSTGDSPYTIARKHDMQLSEFLRLNRLTPRSTIFPGQTFMVKAE